MIKTNKNLLNTTFLLKYKGYLGSLEFSSEDNILFGRVLGLEPVTISYEGSSLEELKNDFHDGVDHYLYSCQVDGEEPLTTDLEMVKNEIGSTCQKLSEKLTFLEDQELLTGTLMVQ